MASALLPRCLSPALNRSTSTLIRPGFPAASSGATRGLTQQVPEWVPLSIITDKFVSRTNAYQHGLYANDTAVSTISHIIVSGVADGRMNAAVIAEAIVPSAPNVTAPEIARHFTNFIRSLG
jgi:hypothetical protein